MESIQKANPKVLAFKLSKWFDQTFAQFPASIRPTKVLSREELTELITQLNQNTLQDMHRAASRQVSISAAEQLEAIRTRALQQSDAWSRLKAGITEIKTIGESRGTDLVNIIWFLLQEGEDVGKIIMNDPEYLYKRWQHYTKANGYNPPSYKYVKQTREWWMVNQN